MLAAHRARWATLAFALALSLPASADRAKRSLADCASFEQLDKTETAVAFTIRNACSIPIDCAVSWRVVCAPDSKRRRAEHPGAARFALPDGGSESTEASAAVCGADAWSIDSVRWRCEPDKS